MYPVNFIWKFMDSIFNKIHGLQRGLTNFHSKLRTMYTSGALPLHPGPLPNSYTNLSFVRHISIVLSPCTCAQHMPSVIQPVPPYMVHDQIFRKIHQVSVHRYFMSQKRVEKRSVPFSTDTPPESHQVYIVFLTHLWICNTHRVSLQGHKSCIFVQNFTRLPPHRHNFKKISKTLVPWLTPKLVPFMFQNPNSLLKGHIEFHRVQIFPLVQHRYVHNDQVVWTFNNMKFGNECLRYPTSARPQPDLRSKIPDLGPTSGLSGPTIM